MSLGGHRDHGRSWPLVSGCKWRLQGNTMRKDHSHAARPVLNCATRFWTSHSISWLRASIEHRRLAWSHCKHCPLHEVVMWNPVYTSSLCSLSHDPCRFKQTRNAPSKTKNPRLKRSVMDYLVQSKPRSLREPGTLDRHRSLQEVLLVIKQGKRETT